MVVVMARVVMARVATMWKSSLAVTVRAHMHRGRGTPRPCPRPRAVLDACLVAKATDETLTGHGCWLDEVAAASDSEVGPCRRVELRWLPRQPDRTGYLLFSRT